MKIIYFPITNALFYDLLGRSSFQKDSHIRYDIQTYAHSLKLFIPPITTTPRFRELFDLISHHHNAHLSIATMKKRMNHAYGPTKSHFVYYHFGKTSQVFSLTDHQSIQLRTVLLSGGMDISLTTHVDALSYTDQLHGLRLIILVWKNQQPVALMTFPSEVLCIDTLAGLGISMNVVHEESYSHWMKEHALTHATALLPIITNLDCSSLHCKT